MTLYDEIISNYPNSQYIPGTLVDRIKLAIRKKDTATAAFLVDDIISCLEGDPGLPKYLYSIAEEYENIGFKDESQNLYARISEVFPKSVYSSNAKIRILCIDLLKFLDEGNFVTAAITLKTIKEDFSDSPELDRVYYLAAGRYSIKNKYNESLALYNEVINNYPNSQYMPGAFVARIKLTIKQSNTTKAALFIDELIVSLKDDKALPKYLYSIAREYENNGKKDEGIQLYERIFRLFEKSSYAQRAKIRVKAMRIADLIVAANFTQASEELQEFNKNYFKSESSDEAYYLIAQKYSKAHHFTAAGEIYTIILTNFPKSEYAKGAALCAKCEYLKNKIAVGDFSSLQRQIDEIIILGEFSRTALARELLEIANFLRERNNSPSLVFLYKYIADSQTIYAKYASIALDSMNLDLSGIGISEIDSVIKQYKSKHGNQKDSISALYNVARRTAQNVAIKDGEAIYKAIVDNYSGSKQAAMAQIDLDFIYINRSANSTEIDEETIAEKIDEIEVLILENKDAFDCLFLYRVGRMLSEAGVYPTHVSQSLAQTAFTSAQSVLGVITDCPNNELYYDKAVLLSEVCDILKLIYADKLQQAISSIEQIEIKYKDNDKLARELTMAASSFYMLGKKRNDYNFYVQSIALYRDFIIPNTIDNNHRASAYYTVGLNYEAMGLLKKTAENFVLAYNADPAHKFAESCIYKAGYYFDIVTQKGEIEQSVGVNLAKQCYLELINKFPNSKHYQEAEDWLKLNL